MKSSEDAARALRFYYGRMPESSGTCFFQTNSSSFQSASLTCFPSSDDDQVEGSATLHVELYAPGVTDVSWSDAQTMHFPPLSPLLAKSFEIICAKIGNSRPRSETQRPGLTQLTTTPDALGRAAIFCVMKRRIIFDTGYRSKPYGLLGSLRYCR